MIEWRDRCYCWQIIRRNGCLDDLLFRAGLIGDIETLKGASDDTEIDSNCRC